MNKRTVEITDESGDKIAEVEIHCYPVGDEYAVEVELLDGKPSALFTVYTAQEAAEKWGLAEVTVRQWIYRGKFRASEARKSAGTWLVTHDGMVRVAGEPKNEEEIDMNIYLSNDSVVEKYLQLALKNPDTPFIYGNVKVYNMKRFYDFVAEHAKNVVFEEVLKEAINSEGCYEMPSWMTRSGKPECIYFDREDEIDNETYDVTTIIKFR